MSTPAKTFIVAKTLEDAIDQMNSLFEELFKKHDVPIIHTRDGGIALQYKNESGVKLERGNLVALGTIDSSVVLTLASALNCIGVVYEQIPIGEEGYIIISGKAYFLLKDTVSSVAGDYVITSDVIGRADNNASIIANRVIGIFEETKSSGTNVLALATFSFY